MNAATNEQDNVPKRGRARRIAVGLAAAGALTAWGLAAAHGDGGRRVGHLADRLDLTDAQTDALGVLAGEMGDVRDALRGQELRTGLEALVAAPTLDQGAALALIEGRADALRAAAPELVAAAAVFHDGLDENQRGELGELLERTGRGFGGRHGGDR